MSYDHMEESSEELTERLHGGECRPMGVKGSGGDDSGMILSSLWASSCVYTTYSSLMLSQRVSVLHG